MNLSQPPGTILASILTVVGGFLGIDGLIGGHALAQTTMPTGSSVMDAHLNAIAAALAGGAALLVAARQLIVEIRAGEGPILGMLAKAVAIIRGKPTTSQPLEKPDDKNPEK